MWSFFILYYVQSGNELKKIENLETVTLLQASVHTLIRDKTVNSLLSLNKMWLWIVLAHVCLNCVLICFLAIDLGFNLLLFLLCFVFYGKFSAFI